MKELFIGFGVLILYFLCAASAALLLRNIIRLPKEVFRKILHFILLGSVFVFTEAFQHPSVAALASAFFALLLYPVLQVLERVPGYSDLLTERGHGEIKRSLLLVFFMFSFILLLCWGILERKYLVLASVLAWGVGDAAAALFGKKFGRNRLRGRGLSGEKTLEGFLAMFFFSFVAVFTVFLRHQPDLAIGYGPLAFVTAGVTAVVELYSMDGMDTVTCPLAAAVTMIPLTVFLGG